ncbi:MULTISPECIES: hypothetical protein [Nostocales]|uniref:Uncharacterized protein n=3 Tax=Nostocales TaxID=1161 RepID=A0A0C1RI64_9CYAN|nr:hypothetical protein [Tolypothrix bouteillei]KAF3887553.1 hypothetical protein DA73_0400020230 [Tolypothrix bouteillei VB521301]
MAKLYKYRGPENIRLSVAGYPVGTRIKSVDDLKRWINQTQQKPNIGGAIAATFMVDSEGYICVADRHSEHVACAGGKSVLSAGEIFFAYNKQNFEVLEITNQSTGYCPEPESWSQVEKALEQIPIPHPGHFSTEFIFRRCPVCRQVNIVKNNLFLCAVCNTNLPKIWNLSPE